MGERDPDRELVDAAQAQLPYGTTAYNELVKRHSDAVFQALPRYRAEQPFAHWLNVITLNTCNANGWVIPFDQLTRFTSPPTRRATDGVA